MSCEVWFLGVGFGEVPGRGLGKGTGAASWAARSCRHLEKEHGELGRLASISMF